MTNPYQQQPPYPGGIPPQQPGFQPQPGYPPQHPGYPPAGQPMGYGPPSVPPRKPKRTGLIVALSVVAAVVVISLIAVVALLVPNLGGSSAQREPEPPLTELPIAAGSGPAPSYGPAQVPNACSLIPLDLFQSRGWALAKQAEITERLADPQDPAPQPIAEYGSFGLANCTLLFDNDAQVAMEIHAAPLEEPSSIADDLRLTREDSTPYTEGNWEVLIENEPGSNPAQIPVTMTDGSTRITFLLTGPDGTSRDQMLELTRQAMAQVAGKWNITSKSPSVAKYPAPYGEVPDPCSALTAGDLREVFGPLPNSGMITRTWNSSPVRLQKQVTLEPVEYVEATCHQDTLEADDYSIPDQGSFDLTVRTFPDAAKAAEEVAFYADPNSEITRTFGQATPVNAKIGDGPAYVSPAFPKEYSLLFHTGRYVISLAATDNTSLMDGEALTSRVIPVAQKVSERLR